MPQVPTYSADRLVRTEALRPVLQQTPDVSSGALAVARGLGQVAEAADRLDLRDAEAKANEVDATITTEWLKWDAANRNKYRGENVDGYQTAAQEWWKTAAETYGKDMSPRARALASGTLVRKQGTAMANVLQFVGAEKERHADESAQASINSTIQFGVTTGNVAGAAVQVREQVAKIGARKGWTTEQVQAEQVKNLSMLHLAEITKLASENATKAQDYYQANKAEVAAATQPRIEEVIKGEGDNQFAKTEAVRIRALDPESQKAELAKITDPKRLEKTQIELNNLSAIDRRMREEAQGAARDQVYQLFEQRKPIPEALLSAMGGPERSQFENLRLARSEREAAGKPVKTDMATYIDVREKLARGERVDLKTLTEKIAPAQMEQLLDIQTTVRKGGLEQDSMLTDEQRIKNSKPAYLDPKTNPNEYASYVNEVDARVRAASRAKGGKPLTPDEKQKIIDDVVKDEVYVKRFFGSNTKKAVSMLTPDEAEDAYVPITTMKNGKDVTRYVAVSSVPKNERDEIIAERTRLGLPVTMVDIVKAYEKHKGIK